jgi:hypothetical protein
MKIFFNEFSFGMLDLFGVLGGGMMGYGDLSRKVQDLLSMGLNPNFCGVYLKRFVGPIGLSL